MMCLAFYVLDIHSRKLFCQREDSNLNSQDSVEYEEMWIHDALTARLFPDPEDDAKNTIQIQFIKHEKNGLG